MPGSMRKHIAHLVQGANGPLTCECTDTITCGNCVQANLILMQKRYRAEDDSIESFIRSEKRTVFEGQPGRLGSKRKVCGAGFRAEPPPPL